MAKRARPYVTKEVTVYPSGKTRMVGKRRVAQYAVQPAPAKNVRTGGFVGIERKFVDYSITGDAFTNVWTGGEMEDATALSLSAVAQGDGENQRDGRRYTIHSVFVRGCIYTSAYEAQATPVSQPIHRIALVWDRQTNGAQLNAEDVFSTVAAARDVHSMRNLQYTKRFTVLQDKILSRPTVASNEGAINAFASSPVAIPFKLSYKFKVPIVVNCSGTTAAIASIVDNSLHLIGTATDTGSTLQYTSRVRFTG